MSKLALVKDKSLALQDAPRSELILRFAALLDERREDIFKANELDMDSDVAPALKKRLKLDAEKLATVLDGLRVVAAMEDPLGAVDLARELSPGLVLRRVSCPIGVVAVIFEARPDALPQIAALALKAGDGVVLKGGREALHTNRALFACLEAALAEFSLCGAALLLEEREDVKTLLTADKYVDLIIPRGSNELVSYIQSNTRIPVLGHAEGICHIYIDKRFDQEKALHVVLDAKTSYPAACNSVETLLIHKDVELTFIEQLCQALWEAGVELRLESALIAELSGYEFFGSDGSGLESPGLESLGLESQGLEGSASKKSRFKEACEKDWSTEYCDLTLSVKRVSDLEAAIKHINEYGSGHTDAIITEDEAAFERFFKAVNSASVYKNASTRFADGFRYGFGAEVGISTARMHPRGPVGLSGLVSYKYRLDGSGQGASDFNSSRPFTHRDL